PGERAQPVAGRSHALDEAPAGAQKPGALLRRVISPADPWMSFVDAVYWAALRPPREYACACVLMYGFCTATPTSVAATSLDAPVGMRTVFSSSRVPLA